MSIRHTSVSFPLVLCPLLAFFKWENEEISIYTGSTCGNIATEVDLAGIHISDVFFVYIHSFSYVFSPHSGCVICKMVDCVVDCTFSL